MDRIHRARFAKEPSILLPAEEMEGGVGEGRPDEPERREGDQRIAQPSEADDEGGSHSSSLAKRDCIAPKDRSIRTLLGRCEKERFCATT